MWNRVVVGYDRTPSSEFALTEAAREAAGRGAGLVIVHAYHRLDPEALSGGGVGGGFEDCRKVAEEIVERGADRVRALYPGLSVTAEAVNGGAARVLTASARHAGLLVVGDRGRGGFDGMLLGRTPMRVIAEVRCPVLVVRGGARTARDRVVAAVDIEGSCDYVLGFAFEEASRRGADLVVVSVWDEPWAVFPDEEPGPGLSEDVSAVLASRVKRLDAHLDEWYKVHPDVHFARRVTTGSASAVLIEATGQADLVVTGARRHEDGQHGMQIGPVTHTLLRHADCPVAVVPSF